jgi:hypothetical protein
MAHIVHCNANGRPCRVGRSIRLLALRSYGLKFNPTIDDILRQPNEKYGGHQSSIGSRV